MSNINGESDVTPTESNRMLKKSASGVLASFRSSTYPRGYASGLHSLRPCWTAFLSILRPFCHRPILSDSNGVLCIN